MGNKTRNLLRWSPSVLVALMMSAGGILKLAAWPALAESFAKTGLLPYMSTLGVTELLITTLFLWQRSMRIGFFMLTGYLGGAMAVELSNGMLFIAPAFILALAWVAAFLRDPSLFGLFRKNNLLRLAAQPGELHAKSK